MLLLFRLRLTSRSKWNCAVRRFRFEDQSRIAGVCREIREVGVLELTLCSNWRQPTSQDCEPSTRQRNYCAAHIDFRYRRKGMQLRRSLVSILCNWLLRQGFLDLGERREAVDSLGAKTIMFGLGRSHAVAKPSALFIEIDHGD
jgi:hypothetical protein